MFFVFIAFVTDLICYILLPIQWLFFAASSYVWIQYVWQTGTLVKAVRIHSVTRALSCRTWNLSRDSCALGAVRLARSVGATTRHQDDRSVSAIRCALVRARLRPLSRLTLRRSFSIGYPMVTLGFGFKTYLAYKWRLVSPRVPLATETVRFALA